MKLLRFESQILCFYAFCEKGPSLNLKKYCITNGLTLKFHGQRPACYPTMFLVCIDRDWYVPISTNRCLDILTETQKQNPLTVDDASTAEAAPKRVERDGQGETRRANTTPNGRPHLELGRLRLKTWSKSDFSIAETTWPTHL